MQTLIASKVSCQGDFPIWRPFKVAFIERDRSGHVETRLLSFPSEAREVKRILDAANEPPTLLSPKKLFERDPEVERFIKWTWIMLTVQKYVQSVLNYIMSK